jgi:hypothetical protein
MGYRIPSLAYRILVAALRLIASFVLFVALPVAVLAYVHSRGLAIPISVAAVTTWGAVLLALTGARYILKPTVAYGPLSIAVAAVFFAYLYYLVLLSPYRFVLPGGSASIAAGYSLFLELLMIVPVVEMIAGVLTTIEDVAWPRERLPFDYPA